MILLIVTASDGNFSKQLENLMVSKTQNFNLLKKSLKILEKNVKFWKHLKTLSIQEKNKIL
jgi:hypothetical protein